MSFDIKIIFFLFSSFIGVTLILVYIILKITTTPYPKIIRYNDEKYFLTENSKHEEFPSINDNPTIDLSVIVPAYDEEQRLPTMMDECLYYLETRCKKDKHFRYEIIIVSDGSKDNTVGCAMTYTMKYTSEKVRVLALSQNRGKGGAVRLGMRSARGKYLLFADADGATKFSDYDKLELSMKHLASDWKTDAIVCGSRAHLEQDAIASRSFFRTFLMHGFHCLVWLFAVRKIRDTQCGFKLLTRSAAKVLFSIMHVERWAFDVELLYLAQFLKVKMDEIAVNWTEIDGSKVTPFWSWLQMGRDLFLIWFRYTTGVWRIKLNHLE